MLPVIVTMPPFGLLRRKVRLLRAVLQRFVLYISRRLVPLTTGIVIRSTTESAAAIVEIACLLPLPRFPEGTTWMTVSFMAVMSSSSEDEPSR